MLLLAQTVLILTLAALVGGGLVARRSWAGSARAATPSAAMGIAAVVLCLAAPALLWIRFTDVIGPAGLAPSREAFRGYLELATGRGQAAQTVLALAAAAAVFLRLRPLSGLLALLAAGAGAATGHFVTYGLLPGLAHAAHLAGAAVWLGVLWLLGLAVVFDRGNLLRVVRRGSAVAAGAMAVIVATGILSGLREIGGWPALVGTPSGRILLWKLAALGGALVTALALRTDFRGIAVGPWLPRVVSLDAGLALTIVIAAVLLSQTVPGAHDDIAWPFALRPNPTVALRDPARDTLLYGALGASALLLAAAAVLWRRRRFALAVPAALLAVTAGPATAMYSISVEAYPTTYLHPDFSYRQELMADVGALYDDNCAACHGPKGRGDGPLARDLPVPPADLTGFHMADHTMGDMFWWVTNGRSDIMPPFGDSLSVADRWALVHYAHLMSLGREARILPEPPMVSVPFAPAIDFAIDAPDGTRSRLVDPVAGATPTALLFPGTGTCLQLDRPALAAAAAGAGGRLVVAGDAAYPRPVDPDGVWWLWQLYAPTLETADDDTLDSLLFVVDRWGFLRARWRCEAGAPAPAAADVAAALRSLAGEAKTRDWLDHDG